MPKPKILALINFFSRVFIEATKWQVLRHGDISLQWLADETIVYTRIFYS